jgi:phosphoribosylanthranilate isomerase
MVELKFCGMTRAEDVREAGALGARYVGVIFAESPRQLTAERALKILDAATHGTTRVGVFGTLAPKDVAHTARAAGLDVVQLHGDPDAAMLRNVRRHWSGPVWAVLRITGAELPVAAAGLFDAADAVVLDARVDGTLGGTGTALAWEALREPLARVRAGRARLVLAGGLHADNVAGAIAAIEPHVVDVSSGIESGVGIKDHAKMREFRDAAYAAVLR